MSLDKNRAWKLLEDISFVRVAGTEPDKFVNIQIFQSHLLLIAVTGQSVGRSLVGGGGAPCQ